MNKFNAGDWVRDTRQGMKKPIVQLKPNCIALTNPEEYAIQYIPWVPEVNEWCWFWNNGSQAFLGQYDGVATSSTSTWYMCKFVKHSNTITSIYDNIEPFFGELPSFLKDQK